MKCSDLFDKTKREFNCWWKILTKENERWGIYKLNELHNKVYFLYYLGPNSGHINGNRKRQLSEKTPLLGYLRPRYTGSGNNIPLFVLFSLLFGGLVVGGYLLLEDGKVILIYKRNKKYFPSMLPPKTADGCWAHHSIWWIGTLG